MKVDDRTKEVILTEAEYVELVNRHLSEEPVSESIDFEQELYKAFGQIKDFTLGIAIAKRFYDMGRKHKEPVSEELEKAAVEWFNSVKYKSDLSGTPIEGFKAGAKWKEEQMIKNAVETSVCALLDGLHVIIKPEYLKEYRFGEKVKVKIFKEK